MPHLSDYMSAYVCLHLCLFSADELTDFPRVPLNRESTCSAYSPMTGASRYTSVFCNDIYTSREREK